MPIAHVVEEGEHISEIAERYGFVRYETVWEEPLNAELRASRSNPHVLQPGDVVHVPDFEPATAQAATGRRHRFVAGAAELRLRVRIEAWDGGARADRPCALVVDGRQQELMADGQGLVEVVVSASAKEVELAWDDHRERLAIGGLDPVTSPSGVASRLVSLAYPLDPDDPESLRFCIELFELDAGLSITGELGASLEAALEEVFGA